MHGRKNITPYIRYFKTFFGCQIDFSSQFKHLRKALLHKILTLRIRSAVFTVLLSILFPAAGRPIFALDLHFDIAMAIAFAVCLFFVRFIVIDFMALAPELLLFKATNIFSA